MMKRFSYIIKEAVGIHARPASRLVKEASIYESTVNIEACGKRGDAKRLLSLMILGVTCGQEVTFEIEGADEVLAAERLEEFCRVNL
ncbi:MAG: phosphocarrier protein HPr [Bacillota bacterium]|jgi:phosphocarrier protein|nr:phosphocarrier protein HPr [Bacillota bacterium]